MSEIPRTVGNFFLTGFTASGKTSVGRLLSSLLEMPFVDLDELITERSGKSIPVLFRELGEEQYRLLEASLLQEILAVSGRIIALGAGTILFPASRELIQRHGILIYLDVLPEILFDRIRLSEKKILFHLPQDRLPLADEVLFRRVQALYEQRRPFYLSADIIISASELTQDDVVQKIIFALQQFGKPVTGQP